MQEKPKNNGRITKYKIMDLLELTVNRCRQWKGNRMEWYKFHHYVADLLKIMGE